MRTYLSLMLILPLFFLISACKKNTDVVVPNKTIITNVAQNDWRTSDNSKTFYVDIDLPEITADIHETDGVLAYISLGDNIYEQIPETYFGISYNYEVSPGNMRVLMQDAIYDQTITPPQSLKLKIVLIPSSF